MAMIRERRGCAVSTSCSPASRRASAASARPRFKRSAARATTDSRWCSSSGSLAGVGGELKLGLNTGYWAGGPPPGAAEAVAEAERLGFDSIWTAEAYGSDCLTPLAWWGASTERINLGTGIVQMSARQPAATAMAAMTLDHLSNGRLILGLGVSGPQVVEGWYGMPFAKPLARTREYVDIIRQVWARQGPVTAPGPHYPLPYPEGTGLAKALKASIHPLR